MPWQRCTPALPNPTPAIVDARCMLDRASTSSGWYTALKMSSIMNKQLKINNQNIII
jgi:hypothetical protein